jgi:hypothetical protein
MTERIKLSKNRYSNTGKERYLKIAFVLETEDNPGRLVLLSRDRFELYFGPEITVVGIFDHNSWPRFVSRLLSQDIRLAG